MIGQPPGQAPQETLRFVRFLVVGVLNTAVGYGLFAVLILLNLPSASALFMSTALGVLFNYVSTGRVVFGVRDAGRLLPFVMAYGLIYGVNVWLLWLLEAWSVPALQAQAVLLPVMVVISYILNRRLVFAAPWDTFSNDQDHKHSNTLL